MPGSAAGPKLDFDHWDPYPTFSEMRARADEWWHAITLSDNVIGEQLELARKAVANCPERAVHLIGEHD